MSELPPEKNQKDLRLVGRSEDGVDLILVDQDGDEYSIRISDALRAAVNQPRLVSVPAPESAATPVKEIQSRLRAGETPDSIARSTEWELEKIEKFSGPIMQERAYIIGLAIETPLRREAHSPTLAAATIAQLTPRGVDMTLVEWNTWRRDDGLWNVILYYPTSAADAGSLYGEPKLGEANWAFDSVNRTLVSEDENARWISGEEKPSRPANPTHGMIFGAESTGPAPRLSSVKPADEPISPPILTAVTSVDDEDESEEDILELEESPSGSFQASSSFQTNTSSQNNEDEIPADAKRDGVTKRIRIPSWDDIMFGGKKDSDPQE